MILDQDLGYVFLHSPFAENDMFEIDVMERQECYNFLCIRIIVGKTTN